jgi:prepilin-type N-terminal cleavage/methylation domain-containing protein
MKGGRQYFRCFGPAGVTLVELMVAISILVVACGGLLSLFSFCVSQNKSQGEVATRTVEYAQDKMEQLLALQFSDSSSDTTQFPTASSGGTGLGGTTPSSTYGGTNTSSPVTTPGTGYVDYLDMSGNLQGTANYASAFYVRVWQIQTDSTGNLKTITVVASTVSTAGLAAVVPQTTLVCVKANF